MIKTGIAFLLDDSIFIQGEVVEDGSKKIFVPNKNIQCGFSYQELCPEDIGTLLFYDREEIVKIGLGHIKIVCESTDSTILIDKIVAYFEISKEAGLAEDEEGNPSSCYLEFKISFKEPIDKSKFTKTYDEQASAIAKDMAASFNIPVEYIKVISEEEYLSNTEGDDEIDD